MQQYNVIAMTTVHQRQQQEQLRKTTIQTTIQRGRVIVIVVVAQMLVPATFLIPNKNHGPPQPAVTTINGMTSTTKTK